MNEQAKEILRELLAVIEARYPRQRSADPALRGNLRRDTGVNSKDET